MSSSLISSILLYLLSDITLLFFDTLSSRLIEFFSSPLGPSSSIIGCKFMPTFLSVINLLSESLSLNYNIFYLVNPPGEPFLAFFGDEASREGSPSSAKSDSKPSDICWDILMANFKFDGPLTPIVVPYF